MRSSRLLSLIMVLFLLNLVVVVDAAVDQISLFIPAFEGPGSLGQNVATVLNLQIWHSFRRYPWPDNPDNLDFGKALIIWDNSPLSSQSHSEAEKMAKDILAQLVLWGKAYPYGKGIVVQTNLSVPSYRDFRENQLEVWRITLLGRRIEVDIPRRRFELSSIVLRKEVIERYSLPSALKIYEKRIGGEPIGIVGDSYIGIQFEPSLAKVRSGNVEGWVRLPELGKKRTEVGDFVAGIIRIFRGDWQGAASSMRRVVENPNSITLLKIDAYLYWGMALERQGKSGRTKIENAYRLNPYSLTTIRYIIMSDLSALKRLSDITGSKAQKSKLISTMRSTIDRHAYLFPKNDPWLQNVLKIVSETTNSE
ncbi:MAG: hypothetical protein ACMUIU_10030 [bacterium]